MTTGSNSYGQLGHGDIKKRYAFTRVESLRGSRLATVDCGEDHTGAVGGSGGCTSGAGATGASSARETAARTGPRRRSTACPSHLPSRGNTSGRTTARATSTRTSACAGKRRRLSGRWAARTSTFTPIPPPPSTNPRERTVAMKGKGGAGAGRDVRGALEFGGNQRVASTDDGVRRGVEGMGTRDGAAQKSRQTRRRKKNNEN